MDTCPPDCAANNWWKKDYVGAAEIFYEDSKGVGLDKTSASPTLFNKDNYYPLPPLAGHEKAFLWYAKDSSGEHGDVYEGTAHWRIVNQIAKKVDIYDWLKQAEASPIPMVWGYVVGLPDEKMYVKFLTHLAPGKQDLEYIQPCLRDLEKYFNRTVSDYDFEDSTTPILESYTPQNVNTTWTEKPQQTAEPEPEDYGVQELKTVKKDILNDGTVVSTVFLGKMAMDPTEPFETMVFDPGDEVVSTKDVEYNANEREALNTHYRFVDKYNREALNKSSSTETHEPFGFHNDKLYFGKQHHADILSRIMDEGGHSWEDLYDNPPIFGWYYKPNGAVNFSTDTDFMSGGDSESVKKIKDLLEYKFGKPTTEDPDAFSFSGWAGNPIQQTPDVTYQEYLNNGGPSQMKLFGAEIHPDQLSLLPGSSVKAVHITPGEGAHHSENEHPFMYHFPSKTLYYTTQDCHHYHIVPLIQQHLNDQGHESNSGPWVTGDITDPETTGRNWIKFIGTDSGQYPESVINYMQEKFGPRDVMYNGYDGWEPLPDRHVLKEAKPVEKVAKQKREAEWRWSYHPEKKDLEVWEVQNGHPSHFIKTGLRGQQECVQGRIYRLDDNTLRAFYWNDRPWDIDNPRKARYQEEGWAAINKWIVDNNIGVVSDARTA